MKTKIVIIDKASFQDEELWEAAKILRSGGLVAFPTETVYGLGANALDEEAAAKIYGAKGRPSDNPLIAHISAMEELLPLVTEISQAGRRLMETYWPGPLTLILPKSSMVPFKTTGGLSTVAVRMPRDPVANRLIKLAGVPIAAPSANVSGRPSPTTAEHVYQDMDGKIEMIVDGGPVGIGVESTIVDVTGPVPIMLRPGAVTLEMLKSTVGQVEIDPAIAGPVAADVKPKAPGMKYRHYAPKAELVLVEEEGSGQGQGEVSLKAVEAIRAMTLDQLSRGRKVGIICTDETKGRYPKEAEIRSLGPKDSQEAIARNLFGVLREFDSLEVTLIYSESFPKDHLGQAIMNRLTKAAGYHIIKV